MFVPITSEVTIGTGMLLKEIATDRLFEVNERLANGAEIWGADTWRITENVSADPDRTSLTLTRQELSRKYFAEVED
jgi:hypothetical protein